MKNRIKFLPILLTALSLNALRANASKSPVDTTKTNKETGQVMLHPDASTIYLDESGQTIKKEDFMTAVGSGKYIFEPKTGGGRVESIRLKKNSEPLKMGSAAPTFTALDLDGKSLKLADLKGKIVVINFWFTHCAPCIQEIPDMNELVKKYNSDHNVVFVAVTYDSADQVKPFLKSHPFNFNIIPNRPDIIKQYGVTAYPTSLLIDKTGGIAFSLTSNNGTNAAQLDGVIGALKGLQ